MEVYGDGCQSRSNALGKPVAGVATSADAVQGASSISPALRLKLKKAAVLTVPLKKVFISMLNPSHLELALGPIFFIGASSFCYKCYTAPFYWSYGLCISFS